MARCNQEFNLQSLLNSASGKILKHLVKNQPRNEVWDDTYLDKLNKYWVETCEILSSKFFVGLPCLIVNYEITHEQEASNYQPL
jgi:hypothetical protein